jgi:hypothetical protein
MRPDIPVPTLAELRARAEAVRLTAEFLHRRTRAALANSAALLRQSGATLDGLYAMHREVCARLR